MRISPLGCDIPLPNSEALSLDALLTESGKVLPGRIAFELSLTH